MTEYERVFNDLARFRFERLNRPDSVGHHGMDVPVPCRPPSHPRRDGDDACIARSSEVCQDFVAWKTFAISSTASSSFCPCAGSCDFFARPASFVAFQNSSWRSGCFSRCSGLK